MESLKRTVNKKHGNIMAKGNQILEVPRIPTGSLSLDLELGGGIPAGRITTIVGEYSDGKTSVVLKILAEFQQKWPNRGVLWVDAEGAWTPSWSEQLGVQVQDVWVLHPDYQEQAYDIIGEAVKEDIGLVVVDSIAALSPKAEQEKSFEEMTVGISARLNNRWARTMHASLLDKAKLETPTTVILINQFREKVGGYGNPQTEPGGKGIAFASSVRIILKQGELYPKSASKFSTDKVPKGQQILFHIEKNKTAPPKRSSFMWFYFDDLDTFRTKGNYDRMEEVIRYATIYGVVKQRTSAYDIPNMDTGELMTFKGSLAMVEYIRANPRYWTWVEQKLMELIQNEGKLSAGQVVGDDEDNEAERSNSSEELQGQSTTAEWSRTVEEGRHNHATLADTAQASQNGNEVSFCTEKELDDTLEELHPRR